MCKYVYSLRNVKITDVDDGIPDGGSVDLFLLIANPTSITNNSTIATTIAPRLLINAISMPERL